MTATSSRSTALKPALANSGGLLATLKFSSALPKSASAEKARDPRAVVLEALNEQIALVQADIEGTTYTVQKSRFIKNPDGKSVKSMIAVAPRRAFWKADDANWMICLRYGANVPIELVPGTPSIVAGPDLKDVAHVLGVLREVVMTGEADQAIAAAAEKMKRKPKAA